jgi:hypothetical protein
MQREEWMRRASMAAAGLLLCHAALGCATKQPAATPLPTPGAVAEATPVVIPTVPPRTPSPEAAVPLKTRPVMNQEEAAAARRQGKDIGPVVTFAGVARADGTLTEPVGKNAKGIPVWRHPVGSGFMIVIEAKPGIGNIEVGRSIYRFDPADPSQRPDLEIEVNRPLGDGNPDVCDARRPKIGGIPAIDPPSFAETLKVTAALNDFSCRFETFIESSGACTVKSTGDFTFARPDTTVQFCMVVARAWNFPPGETDVSVRVRDVDGNPGPVAHFILDHKELPPTPVRAAPTPTATVPRRRP